MSQKYGFMIETALCTGCKTCQLACKDYKDQLADINYRRVYEYVGGNWSAQGEGQDQTWTPDVFAYYTSIACNHCENPACVPVCPTGAMHKLENGLVDIDTKLCIGCKSCALACPYGAPQYSKALGHMTKCNGCNERVQNGQQPICVESCPLRALDFGPIQELRARYGNLAAIAPLPSEQYTQPHLVIKPNRKARPAGDQSGYIGNIREVK